MTDKNPYSKIHQNILEWYAEHGRVTLPWRNSSSPYEIYLSEIMLQQTQVKTVLERFHFPFLNNFPTLKDVADAPLDDVLKSWEGLGYYTRARNLHKTAIETQGELPSSAEALEKLSGIGKSTAHAVACFAFGVSLPILDANVKRILYRFFAIEKCNDRELWKMAYRLYDRENSYFYNQTLMDIGSMVCTPKNPLCKNCPLESLCQGKKEPLRYPKKQVKKTKPTRKRFMVIYHDDGRYLLERNETQLLGGLWAFAQLEEFDVAERRVTLLGEFTHHYTHFRLDAKVLLVKKENEEKKYFTIEEIDKLALSGADRKALEILKESVKEESE